MSEERLNDERAEGMSDNWNRGNGIIGTTSEEIVINIEVDEVDLGFKPKYTGPSGKKGRLFSSDQISLMMEVAKESIVDDKNSYKHGLSYPSKHAIDQLMKNLEKMGQPLTQTQIRMWFLRVRRSQQKRQQMKKGE